MFMNDCLCSLCPGPPEEGEQEEVEHEMKLCNVIKRQLGVLHANEMLDREVRKKDKKMETRVRAEEAAEDSEKEAAVNKRRARFIVNVAAVMEQKHYMEARQVSINRSSAYQLVSTMFSED